MQKPDSELTEVNRITLPGQRLNGYEFLWHGAEDAASASGSRLRRLRLTTPPRSNAPFRPSRVAQAEHLSCCQRQCSRLIVN